jgi:alkanesulfonate monooxygenase
MEIIGLVHYNSGGPLAPRPLNEFDLGHIVRAAQVQEAAGYDRVLIANAAIMPDPHIIGTHVAASTKTLKLMLAHRPGFIAPTVAARILATIDQVSGGRAGVHIIAGPSDKEVQADGDYLTKEERYHRSFEYVQIMRRVWAADEPFDHEGAHYRFARAIAEVKPLQKPNIPVFWGGASPTAIKLGAQCADIYALTGDSLKVTREQVQTISAVAQQHGRQLRFVSTFIVIIGDTEEQAWRKADDVLEEYLALQASKQADWTKTKGESNFAAKPVNLARQVETAAAGVRQEKCLWMGMAQATQGKAGNQTTLVGTPEQVVDALMDYYDSGVGGFLLRGYRPLDDATAFGQSLIPLLRTAAAARDEAAASVARRASA